MTANPSKKSFMVAKENSHRSVAVGSISPF
jgi:hypothetical protein